MSSYPPPPQPDQQHYNPVYPSSTGGHSQLDSAQQDQLIFNQLSQAQAQAHAQAQAQAQAQAAVYPKVEDARLDASAGDQIEQRIEQLQQQQHSHTHSVPQGHLAPPPQQLQLQLQGQGQQNGQSPGETPQKTNRLRKACDSCSIRKVKCDEAGPPCRACVALDIPCTFERPSRRRGPPNRHAESIKRQRIESPHMPGQSIPSSPTHAAQALAALSSHPSSQAPLSAESICPAEMLDLLINDFFTYIHPLCPFPHEPSFREAWRRREDFNNRPFLALLASMLAALVASFPRKPRLHIKAQRREHMFPNHMVLVEKCQSVCAAARGAGYLESESLSVHDAATSYLLGVAGGYTFRYRQARLYWAEALTILRVLGLHKTRDDSYTDPSSWPLATGSQGPNQVGSTEDHFDHITLQMGRRIFWTIYVTSATIIQCGDFHEELAILPASTGDPYPPLPAEVDDFCVFPTHIEQQPPGLLPMMAGFNANVRCFMSYNPLTVLEVAWGINAVVDWNRQLRVLHDSLIQCKSVMANLPAHLNVWPVGERNGHNEQPNEPGSFAAFQTSAGRRDLSFINADEMEPSPEERRHTQYEIQKSNIYASGLCTRSYIVEKYWNIKEAKMKREARGGSSTSSSPAPIAARMDGMFHSAPNSNAEQMELEMANEREDIVKDLLVVLNSIDRVNFEPNAYSFAQKIRTIAGTLLDVPKERRGSVAQNAEQYLKVFLEILLKLERVSPANSDPDRPDDEEAELRHWADLRECQTKYGRQGGIFAPT